MFHDFDLQLGQDSGGFFASNRRPQRSQMQL
jgi:hypothetical protein